jgi:imidazolonepropionase-like amidohydrolase
MSTRIVIALFAAAAALAAVPLSQAPRAETLAFTHVNVIPMDRDRVLDDHTVVVKGDRIVAIGPSSQVTVPDGARRIEARGQYLLPALAEMHAHIPGGQATDAEIERVLTLYAVNGIGTIRGMLGHPRHLPLRERANAGAILSPWIYTSGPSVNGNTVPTPDAAVKTVADQKAAGYDFIKIHPGVPRPAFDALAEAAHKAGIRFAGHVPAAVGLTRALESRYASIDHLDGYVEALARDGAPASQTFGLNLMGQIDESRIPQLVKATRESGVWMVPTQALLVHWAGMDDPAQMAAWPEMQYVPKDQLAQWTEMKKKITANVTPDDRRRFIEVRNKLIKALHDGGVGFLLGSDGPQVWNVPGFSVHRELRYLVDAGLTPYQALESGTRKVAEFFGTASERGTVAQGRRADLLLVEANPLMNIENSSRIAAVVLGGRLLTRADIDARLAALKALR